jgi:hypothetical protein
MWELLEPFYQESVGVMSYKKKHAPVNIFDARGIEWHVTSI